MQEYLIQVLKEHFGEFIPTKLTGGYTNETLLLKGTQPPLVAKIGKSLNGDILNEAFSLKLLHDKQLAPNLHEMITMEDYQITIMDFKKGVNGQSILDQKDLTRTEELYKCLGESLAKDIHSVKWGTGSHNIRRCKLDIKVNNLDFVPFELIAQSREILKTLQNQKEEWVLTHGDYGIHNVLFDEEDCLTVLDWEWAEWGSPLLDVGWVCWFTNLHYPEHAVSLNSIFIRHYTKVNPIPLTTDLLRGYCIYRVLKILQKVKHASSDVQEEWVRRLRWTIETKLFDEVQS